VSLAEKGIDCLNERAPITASTRTFRGESILINGIVLYVLVDDLRDVFISHVHVCVATVAMAIPSVRAVCAIRAVGATMIAACILLLIASASVHTL
jgi:hypothetical protein